MTEQARSKPDPTADSFDTAEIGALAHLYRGEVYRSTIWRTRLDATTNWSVVTLGLAISISFQDADASPLPLLMVGILIAVFLVLEARRYRYFNVWRARCRWIETNFYAPMLSRSGRPAAVGWEDVLARDYLTPDYHISFRRALGRRLRRNYSFILSFQAIACAAKLVAHPSPALSLAEVLQRMEIGPLPGSAVLVFGVLFHGAWIALSVQSLMADRAKHAGKHGVEGMG